MVETTLSMSKSFFLFCVLCLLMAQPPAFAVEARLSFTQQPRIRTPKVAPSQLPDNKPGVGILANSNIAAVALVVVKV